MLHIHTVFYAHIKKWPEFNNSEADFKKLKEKRNIFAIIEQFFVDHRTIIDQY
jgi:hypothetical protein